MGDQTLTPSDPPAPAPALFFAFGSPAAPLPLGVVNSSSSPPATRLLIPRCDEVWKNALGRVFFGAIFCSRQKRCHGSTRSRHLAVAGTLGMIQATQVAGLSRLCLCVSSGDTPGAPCGGGQAGRTRTCRATTTTKPTTTAAAVFRPGRARHALRNQKGPEQLRILEQK